MNIRNLLLTAGIVGLSIPGVAQAAVTFGPTDAPDADDVVYSARMEYRIGNPTVINGVGAGPAGNPSNGNPNGSPVSVSISYDATTQAATITTEFLGGSATPPSTAVTGPFEAIVLSSRFDERGSSGNNVSGGSLDVSNITLLINGVDQGDFVPDGFFDFTYDKTGTNRITYGIIQTDTLFSDDDFTLSFDLLADYTTFNGNNNNAGPRIGVGAAFVVPEPASIALLGAGALVALARRRNTSA
ncbi:MAG: PEP-CTERM sorting domain-containing protein [Planctomycetota bacterium]